MLHAYASEYLHKSSMGDLSICKKTIKENGKNLGRLYDEKCILGYGLIL
jgi:hypothetical protein